MICPGSTRSTKGIDDYRAFASSRSNLKSAGKPTAEGAQTLQQLCASRLARDLDLPGVCNAHFDLVAFSSSSASTTGRMAPDSQP